MIRMGAGPVPHGVAAYDAWAARVRVLLAQPALLELLAWLAQLSLTLTLTLTPAATLTLTLTSAVCGSGLGSGCTEARATRPTPRLRCRTTTGQWREGAESARRTRAQRRVWARSESQTRCRRVGKPAPSRTRSPSRTGLSTRARHWTRAPRAAVAPQKRATCAIWRVSAGASCLQAARHGTHLGHRQDG